LDGGTNKKKQFHIARETGGVVNFHKRGDAGRKSPESEEILLDFETVKNRGRVAGRTGRSRYETGIKKCYGNL